MNYRDWQERTKAQKHDAFDEFLRQHGIDPDEPLVDEHNASRHVEDWHIEAEKAAETQRTQWYNSLTYAAFLDVLRGTDEGWIGKMRRCGDNLLAEHDWRFV